MILAITLCLSSSLLLSSWTFFIVLTTSLEPLQGFCSNFVWMFLGWTSTKFVKIGVLPLFFMELWVISCNFWPILKNSIKPLMRNHSYLVWILCNFFKFLDLWNHWPEISHISWLIKFFLIETSLYYLSKCDDQSATWHFYLLMVLNKIVYPLFPWKKYLYVSASCHSNIWGLIMLVPAFSIVLINLFLVTLNEWVSLAITLCPSLS